jgi:hypothetical protein
MRIALLILQIYVDEELWAHILTFVFCGTGMELRASHMLGKCSGSELHPQTCFTFLI